MSILSNSVVLGAGTTTSLYVEDVFNTYLYTGSGSTPQTLTTDVNLADNNGAVLYKARTGSFPLGTYTQAAAFSDLCWGTKYLRLIQNSSGLPSYFASSANPWTTTGITTNTDVAQLNASSNTYVAYTFRNADKFFKAYDGSVPVEYPPSNNIASFPELGTLGMVIAFADYGPDIYYYVWHRSLAAGQLLQLTSSSAQVTSSFITVSGTDVKIEAAGLGIHPTGAAAVYAFAHDAGGFGANGNESIIKCGTYTGNGSTNGPTVDLGWEPQWLLVKRVAGTGDWLLIDNMRGTPVSGSTASLLLNANDLESSSSLLISTTTSGFQVNSSSSTVNTASNAYIYVAIRRGPMKTPTDATKVFGLNARTGTGANATVTGGQVVDAALIKNRGSAVADLLAARLTGFNYLVTSSTAAELTAGATVLQTNPNPWDVMDGVKVGTTSTITNASSNTFINYLFRRAPRFFDVVAYTGTGVARTVPHNLGVAPELIIIKCRNTAARSWIVYYGSATSGLVLDSPDPLSTSINFFNNTQPTASVFTLGAAANVNESSAQTYIAYLFASCPGVSKVGSYTGTGTTLQINCGFTAGARFVMIKRTDSTGDWYVWDTARGIISGNDPYLLLNSTAAEVTGTDYIDPYSAGFEISSTAPAAINANGGSFIYLSIA